MSTDVPRFTRFVGRPGKPMRREDHVGNVVHAHVYDPDDYSPLETRINQALAGDTKCHICRQPVYDQDPYMRLPTCRVCPETEGYYSRTVRNVTVAGVLVVSAILIAIFAIVLWENMI